MRRGSKWNAICSFFGSQIGARLVQADVCVAFPKQTSLLVPPNMKGSMHFIWPGLYDFEEMSFLLHFLRPEDLFLDVGANIGVFTVLASGVVGARTVAFEPAPFAYQYLAKNILLNNLTGTARGCNAALGRTKGKIRFTTGLGTENHVVQSGSHGETTEVEVSTLDEQTKGLEPVLIKIDVEGFEEEVLAGGSNCLAKPSLQALIVERVGNAGNYGHDEASVHNKIRDLGFTAFTYAPLPRTLEPIPENFIGNVIYVKNRDTVSARLRTAAAYQFAGKTI